jgi:hypothetical protein
MEATWTSETLEPTTKMHSVKTQKTSTCTVPMFTVFQLRLGKFWHTILTLSPPQKHISINIQPFCRLRPTVAHNKLRMTYLQRSRGSGTPICYTHVLRDAIIPLSSLNLHFSKKWSCPWAYLSTTPWRRIVYLTKHRAMKTYGWVGV